MVAFLEQEDLTGPDRRYVVALSGGIDSMVLLHLLLRAGPNFDITAAHFDHVTREGASTTDAVWVAEYCSTRSIDFVPGVRTAEYGCSEQSLRLARREFLERVAVSRGASAIFTAHHGQDQLETLLMRLMRGTSLRGLGSMRSRCGLWVKPLLDCSKEALCEYAARHSIPYRQDISNFDTHFLRNKIRHETVTSLQRSADTYGGWRSVLPRLNKTLVEVQEASEWIDRKLLAETKAHTEVLPGMMRFALGWFGGRTRFEQLNLMRLMVTACSFQPERATLRRVVDGVLSGLKRQSVHGIVCLELSCGYGYLIDGRRMPISYEHSDGAFRSDYTGITIHVDRDALGGAGARAFECGDRYLGDKLSDLALRARIPAPERRFLPVLVGHTGTILWTPLVQSALARIDSKYPYTFTCTKSLEHKTRCADEIIQS